MKRILVIDGNSIINRAFYGIRPLTTKSGKHTNAIYGAVNMISKQLEAIKPDYAAVAFDLKHPTFRHKMYDGYKAGRRPTPEELISQFDDAKECFRLMGIHVLELPGWEADDIQGTVARMAHAEADTESYIFTGDRDLLQLIDDKTTVLLATNSDTVPMRREGFVEKYGIAPENFVDMKALMGDSSDNIPGVGGIGEKTAGNLIVNFETLEGIYENIDDKRISKGVREKLLRDKENAYLSRDLARIDTSAPVGVTVTDIAYSGFDKAGLYRKFMELELVSFISRFKLDEDTGDVTAKGGDDIPDVEYKEVDLDYAKKSEGRIAIDVKGEKVYIYNKVENLVINGNIGDMGELFQNREVITYGAKPIAKALLDSGESIDSTIFLDLSIYEYVLNPGGGSGGAEPLIAMFLGKTVRKDKPIPQALFELEEVLIRKIREDGLEKILIELEIPLLGVLAKVERNGFKINTGGIEEFGVALTGLQNELANRIYMQAGEVFNLNSPKQLGEVLYERLGLGSGVKKKGTGYPTDADTLEDMRCESPIIDDILEYRQVTKLKSTYTAPLIEAADERSRIHTDFKQTLTATGRLSSADPNLQNIPIKTKMGRELRRFFIAEEGYTLVDADYSQIELRILAHISDDYNMKEAFLEGIDIHTRTASRVFGVDEELVTAEMRKKAKAVNFGIVYGISGFSLAKDIGTSVKEASNYIKSYLLNYLSIDKYLEDVVKDAEEKGYTTTIMGRRRYIPELKSPKAPLRGFGKRVAMNAPIQGTAADIMKLAMINVNNRLQKEALDAKIVMQVHDELVIEARDDLVDVVKEILKEEMENTVSLSIPLTVDVTAGKNWLEQE